MRTRAILLGLAGTIYVIIAILNVRRFLKEKRSANEKPTIWQIILESVGWIISA